MQLKMGRFGWKAGLLCVLAAQLVALFPTPAHGGPGSIAVDVQYPPPPLMGKAAVVYDMDSGLTLYSQGADEHLPVASTTKLMTALLVLEYGHLDDMTTVSYKAATIGESTMYLQAGEQLSLKDLLYGLLLPSGNDAAIALAEAVSGSESAWPFSRMNAAKAEMSVPPVDMPAELAVDCMQLFSRMVIGVLARPILMKAVQMA